MRCSKQQNTLFWISRVLLLTLLSLPHTHSAAAIKDILNLNSPLNSRIPRDNKYFPSRYGPNPSNQNPLNRAIKPEDSPEARESTPTPVEKRCTRCDSNYLDSRYPYESRPRYDEYRDRRYRDRFEDDRRYDRYDRYDDRRYDDRRYDRYDRDDDRYERRPLDRNYDRDRYDRYDRDRVTPERYDRYDRDRYDRYDDRGFGYDNRGYDYRDRNEGYRPWDETYRGSSGFDSSGKGYYFATGRPEVGAGYWGTGGYASGWNYGGGRDDYRGYGGGGGGGAGGSYRPRDPYDGYRSTSYLYGRPSSTTTDRSPNSQDDNGDNGATPSPQQQDNNSSG